MKRLGKLLLRDEDEDCMVVWVLVLKLLQSSDGRDVAVLCRNTVVAPLEFQQDPQETGTLTGGDDVETEERIGGKVSLGGLIDISQMQSRGRHAFQRDRIWLQHRCDGRNWDPTVAFCGVMKRLLSEGLWWLVLLKKHDP